MTQPFAPPPTTDSTKPAEQQPTQLPATRERERIPVRMGIAPTTIDEAWRLSQYLANSELVPKQFREHPADVLVAIQLGMEVGLPPMSALQSIAVVNGNARLWGDAVLGIVRQSPHFARHVEWYEVDGKPVDAITIDDCKKDTTCAVCQFARHGDPEPTLVRFSVADAKAAKLWNKPGPWQEYPARMLKMRARGFAARDKFPDVLRGIKLAEEVMGVDELDAAPVVREVRRRSETPPSPAAPVAAARQTIGPIGVADVQPFLDWFAVTLADGRVLKTPHAADAAELEKVKGTGHQFTFECEPIDADHATIVHFAIVD